MVPIVSHFEHWDHHWFIWLPGDSTYEAVEVMSSDRSDAESPPLVWVFFTERAPPKRQWHYFNDAQAAAARGARFSGFDFTIAGAVDQPRGVKLSLADSDGRSVEIEAQFGPDARLTTRGAGLTDQSGHSADRHLLLFFREKNAITSNRSVMRAGIDLSRPHPPENHFAPWPAAYSRNIFVAIFPFEERRVAFGARGPAEPNLARFVEVDTSGVLVAHLADGTKLELATTSDGRLKAYRHLHGRHVLEIDFAPPLPPTNKSSEPTISAFRISVDGFRDLFTGAVEVIGGEMAAVVDWRFESPEWARGNPLTTNASFEGDGLSRIALRRFRDSAHGIEQSVQ
jgi:hypothetical protein